MFRRLFGRKRELHYVLCVSGRYPAIPLQGVVGHRLPEDILEQIKAGEAKHRELARDYCEHRGVGYW